MATRIVEIYIKAARPALVRRDGRGGEWEGEEGEKGDRRREGVREGENRECKGSRAEKNKGKGSERESISEIKVQGEGVEGL